MLAPWILLAAAVSAPPGPVAADAAAALSVPAAATATDAATDPAGAWNDLCLRRAVHFWTLGDADAAVEALLARDAGAAESDPDRADFLLAYGLRAQGDTGAEAALRSVLEDPKAPEWTRALAALILVDRAASASLDPADLPPTLRTPVLDAALEARRGGSPQSARAAWERLAESDARGALEQELVRAARLRLAAEDADAGVEPRRKPDHAPGGSAASASTATRRAEYLAARAALARAADDERADAIARLEHLLTRAPGSPESADIHHTLGIEAMRDGRWADAHRHFAAVEQRWSAEGEALRALAADVDATGAPQLWEAWAAEGDGDGQPGIAPDRLERAVAAVVGDALDLRAAPDATDAAARPDDLRLGRRDPSHPADLEPPDAADRARVAAAVAARRAAATERERRERALDLARTRAADEVRYRDHGMEQAGAQQGAAQDVLARAEAMVARAEALVALLGRARDTEVRRIAERTGAFVEQARRNLIVARAMRHFRTEGPQRAERLPHGIPAPAEVLDAEVALIADLESWFGAFAEIAPELVSRSHDEIWVPRATDGPRELAAAAAARVARSTELVANIRAERNLAADPARFRDLEADLEFVRGLEAGRVTDVAAVRQAAAGRAVDAAAARHAARGEALAWSLAVATHELGVQHGDTPEGGALRREAAARYETFLASYPDAPARSEVRFRFADALLQVARDDFRASVERFLGEAPDADDWARPELAPFVETGGALEQFFAILEEDPEWVHRDAVLFQAGMLLSDDADTRGRDLLTQLVTAHPESRHAPAAHLRLGDERFDQGDWLGCLDHFERAAAGPDPEQTAIALYKIGWANFSLDRPEAGARSYVRLLDHYDAHPEAARTTDLRDETEDHLVHCLARGGGAGAFASLFDDVGPRAWERRTLGQLGHLLRGVSLFDDAAACDSLWLARWPNDAETLAAAERLVETRARAGTEGAARAARLELAPRFRPGTPWADAQNDSVRAAGDAFAREAYKTVALESHHAAREHGQAADWREALTHYGTLLDGWPDHAEASTFHYYSGEAAAALDDPAAAVAHFDAAARDADAPFAVDAAWHAIAARDAWYESTRSATPEPPGGAAASGEADLARNLVESIDAFAAAHAADERVADLRWRRSHLAYEHDWKREAADAFGAFAAAHPVDERALDALRLRAQALYEMEAFDESSTAYGEALVYAERAGADSVAAELRPLLPHCRFRHAESMLAARHRRLADAATVFEEIEARWPDWEDADAALYRAGLTWSEAMQPESAVRAWTAIADRHPDSDYARDALLKIAETWETEERPAVAATAYERFGTTFPDDADAGSALLRAADLLAEAGDQPNAERLQDDYLARWPADTDAAFAILEPRARRDLAAVSPSLPISTLLQAGPQPAGAALRRYLALATEHDSLAAPAVLAEVRFLRGEEARRTYETARLSQPLEPALRTKQTLLEGALEEYRAASAYGAMPWNRAAAYRIGECLIGFGDALMDSERPADLQGDDLLAYDEVLEERSWEFWDRGEEAWTGLIRQIAPGTEEEWVERARSHLWPRVARRFLHRPEFVHPVLSADPPADEESK